MSQQPISAEFSENDFALVTSHLGNAGYSPALSSLQANWLLCRWDQVLETDVASECDEGEHSLAYAIQGSASQLGDNYHKAKALYLASARSGEADSHCRDFCAASLHFTLARAFLCDGQEEKARWMFRQSIHVKSALLHGPGIDAVRRAIEAVRMGFIDEGIGCIQDQVDALANIRHRMEAHESYSLIIASELDLVTQQQALFSKASSSRHIDDLSDSESKTDAGALTDFSRLNVVATAQLGQDLWVLERTNYKREGFFVEFGATDGVLLSNTYLLERQFNWSGICVEPHPRYFERLQKNRGCIVSDACIAAKSGQEVEFILANEFSTIRDFSNDLHSDKRDEYVKGGHVIQLSTTSLNELLQELGAPTDIDFMSVDTEGSEYEILRDFPFEKWNVRNLAIEHNYSDTREPIFQLLTCLGYERTEAQWDDWYHLPDGRYC